MESHNPYQRPQAQVADASVDGIRLAGRGRRLGAAIIDSLIALAIVMPAMWYGGYFAMFESGGPGLLAQAGWGLGGLVLFAAIHYFPLKNSGQTWGKKVAGIRIVDMQGQQPGLGVLLGRRYLFSGGIGLVPFVGGLISMVNVLFIFRSDRRCLHDLVADTRVVESD